MKLRYAGMTDVGRVRDSNEDSWVAVSELGLFIVADGMGGEHAGALASQVVVATLPELVRKYFGKVEVLPGGSARRRMGKAIAVLSTQLRQQTVNEPCLAGMGSTLVCVLIRGSSALVAHMGDSRAYRLRAGRFKQLTKDHTLIQVLLDSGEVTPAEADGHPARGRLTRSLGMEGEALPQVQLLQLLPGDLLMLCTDGLTGMVSDAEILAMLEEPIPLRTRCRQVICAANRAGGEDNITVLLLSLGEDGGEAAQ